MSDRQTSGSEAEIIVDRSEGVAWVTLNRPSKLNAVNQGMAERLLSLADEISLDAGIRVAVLRGAGDRAFCAGSDIGRLDEEEPPDRYRTRALRPFAYSNFGARVLQPVIAMVHGFCLGGGIELALHCDLRIASEDATFGTPEVKWGWLGGGGATQLLPRLVGYGRAMELLTTGEPISASTAYEWGLINHLVGRDDLLSTTERLASIIASRSPLVTQAAKRAVRNGMNTGLAAGMDSELDLVWATFSSAERAAGVREFKERSRRG